ncbi:Hypothetical protein SMAX5B_001477 [Scophthalmus maximus]|uniref:Uncharacterized protein n=1 Tax=Scophthalmus maximus TaxID=52904 RepID=A0A2U9B0W4_SCOMX|nr:Hypothetical protein SMAX5B_001477 [Scophthalmus maximus]
MPIATLVSFVATAVCTVVQHFLPLDESRDEPVSPEEAVRSAAVKLKETGVPGQHLCIIARVFKVARDTCDSAAVLEVAVAAFNAGAALGEIGVHSPLFSVVANVCDAKVDLPEDQNNPISLFTDLYDNIWAREAASAPDPEEVRAEAAAALDDVHVSAPVLSTMADVFDVATASSEPALVLNVAAAVCSAAARAEAERSDATIVDKAVFIT